MPVRQEPPGRAVRVIPFEVWRVLKEDWRKYTLGVDPDPPWLALPASSRVYFTDAESIFVCRDASEFGKRLEIGDTSTGVGVVFFDTKGLDIKVPEKSPGAPKEGLTSGGAREWTVLGRMYLDLSTGNMEAFEIDANGERGGPVV